MIKLEEHLKRCGVSLKPNRKPSGVEAWFPYYAGFSSDFVREALAGLSIAPGARVLDPWNGAGTTTSVADQLGCDALGYDINPVTALVASARLTRGQDAAHSTGLASELVAIASRHEAFVSRGDPLLSWLSPRLTRRFRSIEAAALSLLGTKGGLRIDLRSMTPPPFAAFFLLCLIRSAKGFACLKQNSNPTWVSAEKRGDARIQTFDRMFLAMVDACAADAERHSEAQISPRATASSVGLADSRALPIGDASIDAIVTSPPYCTRIDYFRATLFELAALGFCPEDPRFQELRRMAMGTNLVRQTAEVASDAHPDEVQTLLNRIRSHPSKASATYYYKHFTQYFDDARASLREIGRVLKPKSIAVIVVQSSYYKELPVPLGDLYATIGSSIGLRSRVMLRVPVRRVLASINTRASRHAPDRTYTEDVVALERVA